MAESSMPLRQRMRGWLEQLKSILLALALVLIVRTVVAEPYRVPSPSMVPTLLVGDELIASKYAYGYSKYSSPIGLMPDFAGRLLGKPPERGDVIVFRLPRDPSITYVKRLIGLPGDHIRMQDGRLYINGTMVARRPVGAPTADGQLYIETLPGGREHEIVELSDTDRHDNTPVFVVPPGHYFMMGDNRDNSLDSRIAAEDGGVGFVPQDNLVARADRILLSRNPDVSWLDVAHWSHVLRLSRFLDRIN